MSEQGEMKAKTGGPVDDRGTDQTEARAILKHRSSPRTISNAQLHTPFTRRFYLHPINPVVFRGPYYLVVWENSS